MIGVHREDERVQHEGSADCADLSVGGVLPGVVGVDLSNVVVVQPCQDFV